ncbi:hypothetical protein CKO12_11700 [Chromatium okenii]|uniref:hypothetical protein n=1 Tax=Chromatium okenii TaxID=61644 RepID=UPI0019034176|nr:hypothetical protein [Chromatium okenii]MBK1642530.1 hypothetical protein [Chromatium okenii]
MTPQLIVAAATAVSSILPGTLTIATVPVTVSTVVPATGLAGWLGFTTTATTIVAAPITVFPTAIVAVAGLLVYGGIKAYRHLQASS